MRSYAAAARFAVSSPRVKYDVSSSTPQFVLFSFDGSKSVDMLKETLSFAQKMQKENKPLHFTYFINAAYFLTKDTAPLYQPPGEPRGTSRIGFSDSVQDIELRMKAFNEAYVGGNEIGSHSVGHFDGSTWTFDQWKQEFDSFASIMSNVQKNNPSSHVDAPLFLSNIRGFRAPNLGINDSLHKTLKEFNFSYDASDSASIDVWPKKDTYGVWHIPLGIVFLGENKNPIIAMDYTLWMRQSGAKDIARKGTLLWDNYANELEKAYMDYFDTNYNNNRGPIVIANHFSKWNDGVYWEAMKKFAENVCGRPQVRCVTFQNLVDYLNTKGAPIIVE